MTGFKQMSLIYLAGIFTLAADFVVFSNADSFSWQGGAIGVESTDRLMPGC